MLSRKKTWGYPQVYMVMGSGAQLVQQRGGGSSRASRLGTSPGAAAPCWIVVASCETAAVAVAEPAEGAERPRLPLRLRCPLGSRGAQRRGTGLAEEQPRSSQVPSNLPPWVAAGAGVPVRVWLQGLLEELYRG